MTGRKDVGYVFEPVREEQSKDMMWATGPRLSAQGPGWSQANSLNDRSHFQVKQVTSQYVQDPIRAALKKSN